MCRLLLHIGCGSMLPKKSQTALRLKLTDNAISVLHENGRRISQCTQDRPRIFGVMSIPIQLCNQFFLMGDALLALCYVLLGYP